MKGKSTKKKVVSPVVRRNKYYPTDMFTPAKALPHALVLISDSVRGEREDELFYDYMLDKAPDRDQAEIITAIRDDERKHFKMLREIYYQLTGKDLPAPENPAFIPPSSYLEGLKEAKFGELSAVERYRQILYAMPNVVLRNMVTEILTDEIKHGEKWDYLFTLNFAVPAHKTI